MFPYHYRQAALEREKGVLERNEGLVHDIASLQDRIREFESVTDRQPRVCVSTFYTRHECQRNAAASRALKLDAVKLNAAIDLLQNQLNT